MKKNSIIVIVIVIVIVVGTGAFYGGMVYGKSQKGNAFNPGRLQGFNGNSAQRGMRQGANGNFVNGEILSLDDKSITVKIPNNGSKIIFYSQSTAVSKTVDGTISDLKVGDNIMATGDSNTDGSVTAKTIQIRPQFPTNQPPADQPTNPTITPPSNQ